MTTTNRFRNVIVGVLSAALVTGCAKGIDAKPDTSSYEAYVAKVAEDFVDVEAEVTEALLVGLAELEIAEIAEKYSGMSYRQVALAELDRQLQEKTAQYADIREKGIVQMKGYVTLQQLKAEASRPVLSAPGAPRKVSFGVNVKNESDIDLSEVEFEAQLFLEGAKEHVATATTKVNWETTGGLRAGGQGEFTFEVHNADDWTTLRVRNSKNVHVKLKAQNGLDFDRKPLFVTTAIAEGLQVQGEMTQLQEARKILSQES